MQRAYPPTAYGKRTERHEFPNIFRVFSRCVQGIFRVFSGYFQGVLRVFSGCFQSVSGCFTTTIPFLLIIISIEPFQVDSLMRGHLQRHSAATWFAPEGCKRVFRCALPKLGMVIQHPKNLLRFFFCSRGMSLDGRNRAIVIAEPLARVIAAIRITSVRWRS